MRKLFLLLLLAGLATTLIRCGQSGNSNNNTNNATPPTLLASIITDDMDPGRSRGLDSSSIIITKDSVKSALLDSNMAIMFNNNDISNCTLYKSGENYILRDANGKEFTLAIAPGNSETLRIDRLEVYYAIPAIIENDTVDILVSRAQLQRLNRRE